MFRKELLVVRSFSAPTVENRFEKCNVQPKAVLVRLIKANGSEQDRILLKISDAFKYDAEHGGYTRPADITLSGWCDPSENEAPCAK